MSDVCGRRRLAKLAFVIGGVFGKFTGPFLEKESKDTDRPKDSRTTESFALHDGVAFLEGQDRKWTEGKDGLTKFWEVNEKMLRARGKTVAQNVTLLKQEAKRYKREPNTLLRTAVFEAAALPFQDAGLDSVVKFVKHKVLGDQISESEILAMNQTLSDINHFIASQRQNGSPQFAAAVREFRNFVAALLSEP